MLDLRFTLLEDRGIIRSPELRAWVSGDELSNVRRHFGNVIQRFHVYLLTLEGIDVGVLFLENLTTRDYMLVNKLYVLPEFRHRGIARRAMAFAEERARESGCSKITLLCKPLLGNSADELNDGEKQLAFEWLRSFYEGLGYIWNGKAEPGEPMTKLLSP